VNADDEAALRSAEEIELVTTGRRSGRPHVVTLWSAYEDGALWLRADGAADWYRNLLADPRCRVRFASREIEGTYEPIAGKDGLIADDQQGLRHLIELWRRKYGNEWVGDWYVERGRTPVRVRIVNTD
jgi:deazaflavin-dependent oxidoreductase (nitroreductase family)